VIVVGAKAEADRNREEPKVLAATMRSIILEKEHDRVAILESLPKMGLWEDVPRKRRQKVQLFRALEVKGQSASL
jgi:hypothetical protein